MLEMVVDAGSLWDLVPFVVLVLGYGQLVRKLSAVVAEPASGEEKIPLLDTPAQGGGERETADPLRRLLVVWAGAMLPLNAAVCYLVTFYWVGAAEGTIALWHYMLLSHVAVYPVLGALAVLLYSLILAHCKNPKPSAETYHMLRRTSMLDGVVLPPGLVVVAAGTFPAQFAWRYTVWLGTVVYVSQAVVWMQLFRRSRHESLERAAARLAV